MRNVCLLPSHLGDFQTIWKAFFEGNLWNNNPITSCINQGKSLACVSKGQKTFLNVFHLSEETEHPRSALGTEDSTLWHSKACGGAATCPISADLAGCRFQVLLWACGMHSHPVAPSECPRAASALCQHAQPRHSSHSFLLTLLHWVPQLRSPQVCSEAFCILICPLHSALCASRWAVLHRGTPPWSPQLVKLHLKIPASINYGEFGCIHLVGVVGSLTFQKLHLWTCKFPSLPRKAQIIITAAGMTARIRREKGSFRTGKQNMNSTGIKWHWKIVCCFKSSNLLTHSTPQSLIRANHIQLLA